MWYKTNKRLLERILQDKELSPWLGPLALTMDEWEKDLINKSKQKTQRALDFLHNDEQIDFLCQRLEHFLENLAVSCFNVYFPQVQEALNKGEHPLTLSHHFLKLEIDQEVVIKLEPKILATIQRTAQFAKEEAEENPKAQENLKVLSNHKNIRYHDFASSDGEFQALWLDRMYKGVNSYLESIIKKMTPWRKGPFRLLELEIDSEWRSDLKWDRLAPVLPLNKQRVLDVGSGNGYHLWRMLADGAEEAIAIEPFELFSNQFTLVSSLAKYTLDPQGNSKLPQMITAPLGKVEALNAFDKVFCMGVLYHRKDPLLFLEELGAYLNKDGELILETIVIPSLEDSSQIPGLAKGDYSVLHPLDKYAGMTNVYSLPTLDLLKQWLRQSGFQSIEDFNPNITSYDEQRATPLSSPLSLIDFIDPNNEELTIEGYPRPLRVILRCKKS